MDYRNDGYDVEKNGPRKTSVEDLEKRHGHLVYDNAAVPGESFEVGDSFYARLQRAAGKLKIEQRGIERVPEDERSDNGFKALLNTSTMVCALRRGKGEVDTDISRSGSPPTWSSPPSPSACSRNQSSTWARPTPC